MIPALVLAVAIFTALVLVVVRAVVGHGDALDTEHDEQWLVRHAPGWLTRTLRLFDRRVVGGVVVGATFGVLFVVALVVGTILSTVDDDGGFGGWDVAAAEFGRDNATDASTTVLEAITDLGGTGYLLTGMALLGVYHGLRRKDWGPGTYLAVVGVGISLLNNGLKLIIDRERPDIAQLSGHAGSSFPSGHSAAAAACWAAIALVIARRRGRDGRILLSFVAVTVAVAVAATRVLLGVHWLSDVIAGVSVGWAWFFVTTFVFGGRLLRMGEPAQRVAEGHAAASAEDRALLGEAHPPDDAGGVRFEGADSAATSGRRS